MLDTVDTRLKVLRYIAEGGPGTRIEPVASDTARVGHHYPEISKALGIKPGEELSLLESLAETGCLARELVDKVDICPYCLHDNLRLRRLCPHCRSSLIIKKEVLHHFRCGWAGVEDDAIKGMDLVCPKCKTHLQHIGVDYERASQSYYCTTCRKIFAQPLEEFLSLVCGRQIPKDGTMIHPIFVYSLTSVGMEAAIRQSFEDVPLVKGIIQRDLNLYTRNYIERRLSELINRYARYKAGFSAALISIDQYDTCLRARGHVVALDMVKVLSSVLRGETRGVDIAGLFDDSTFILLLPQTSHKGAAVFAKRYAGRIRDMKELALDGPVTVSIAIAGCPEDGEDSESILSGLGARLDQCKVKRGNTIQGPGQATG
jgi:diguanylate cyclase (GGDEF)-like protein